MHIIKTHITIHPTQIFFSRHSYIILHHINIPGKFGFDLFVEFRFIECGSTCTLIDVHQLLHQRNRGNSGTRKYSMGYFLPAGRISIGYRYQGATGSVRLADNRDPGIYGIDEYLPHAIHINGIENHASLFIRLDMRIVRIRNFAVVRIAVISGGTTLGTSKEMIHRHD